MEQQVIAQSPFLAPSFLLSAIVTGVILVVWFVRLEYRANATAKRQEDYEEFMAEQLKEVKANVEKVKTAFYTHSGDTKVHHNEEMFNEFKNNLDRRLNGMERTLDKISNKLDGQHTTHG